MLLVFTFMKLVRIISFNHRYSPLLQYGAGCVGFAARMAFWLKSPRRLLVPLQYLFVGLLPKVCGESLLRSLDGPLDGCYFSLYFGW